MQAIHIVGNERHGAVLYQQNCLTCHGPAGKILAPDFPVPPQGVPSLNPIRRELYAQSAAKFVRNIDPFLQHGMPNPAEGGPDMPAFGDTHALAQAQIADIEAYVLQLNGVDRAQILNPGVEPKTFFYGVLGISLSIGFFCVLWGRKIS
jgi:mono/diheme cytochrome c family protein